MITIDTETHLITPSNVMPRVVSLTHALHDGSPQVATTGDGNVTSTWLAILESGEPLCGANIAFDLACLANQTDTLPQVLNLYRLGLVRDVQIRQRLLDIQAGLPQSSVSLAALVGRHLARSINEGKKAPKGAIEAVLAGDWSALDLLPARYKFGRLDGVPFDQWPEDFKAYALDDVILTRDVYNAQGGGVLVDEQAQCKAAFCLHLMSAWGVRTDGAAVEALAESLEIEHATLEQTMIDYGLIKVKEITRGKNKGTVKKSKNMAQIQALVESALGDRTPKTKTGKTQPDVDALKASRTECLSSGDTDLAGVFTTLIDISGPAKLLQTYIPVLRRGTNEPIVARYDVLKDTGRTSCSGPNLQNLPRKGGIRECYVPRPGNVFIQADWQAAEMLSLAFLNDLWCHGSTMKEAINAGQDLHIKFAANMEGVTYDEFKLRFDAGEKYAADRRQFAKVANFGFPGGLGADTFVDYAFGFGLTVTKDEAQSLKAGFRTTWPEMHAYFAKVASLVGQNTGTITQHASGRERGGVRYTQACNSYFQGLTADFAKHTLWLLTLACHKGAGPLRGWRPAIFVHDEFIVEGPAHEAEAALVELKRIMVKGASDYLPGITVKADGKIMERWTK